MKKLLLALAAAGSVLIVAPAANARQGCGIGFHRGYHGRCLPNRGARWRPAGPVVGVYYPGRGYWYGNRYWRQRYRWHGGWRYR